jgi:hypothetical protein
MKKFIVRALLLVPIMAIAYLTQKISNLYLTNWVRYNLDNDLEMYARWSVLTWVVIGLALVALIWAWVAPDRDND